MKRVKINFKELIGDIPKKILIYILGAIGILLLIVPSIIVKEDKEENNDTGINADYCTMLEEELEEILPKIAGVGKVDVMITAENYGQVFLAKDKRDNDNETVILNVKGGGQDTKIIEEKYPEIRGVIIVAEGGKSDRIKNDISEAICALLSIDAHKIKVFERKITL